MITIFKIVAVLALAWLLYELHNPLKEIEKDSMQDFEDDELGW